MSFNPNANLDPSQVEDRRGGGGGLGGGFGRGGLGGGGFPGGGGMAVGGGGLSILALVVMLLLGVNPFGGGDTYPDQTAYDQPAAVAPGSAPSQSLQECRTGADANKRDDCRVVGFVNSVQDYWNGELPRYKQRYTPAPMVLFSGGTQAGCGYAQEAQGPFYCPVDKKVYIDLAFFSELRQRFGAQGGPFAQGYVIAHEYGHHVQDILGLLDESGGAGAQGPQGSSVRTELQADCLAGVWARHAADTGFLQAPSDAEIADALDAAASVGDDRIQRSTQGRVSPESWTHGSATQRQQWFTNGYRGGALDACNTGSGRV